MTPPNEAPATPSPATPPPTPQNLTSRLNGKALFGFLLVLAGAYVGGRIVDDPSFPVPTPQAPRSVVSPTTARTAATGAARSIPETTQEETPKARLIRHLNLRTLTAAIAGLTILLGGSTLGRRIWLFLIAAAVWTVLAVAVASFLGAVPPWKLLLVHSLGLAFWVHDFRGMLALVPAGLFAGTAVCIVHVFGRADLWPWVAVIAAFLGFAVDRLRATSCSPDLSGVFALGLICLAAIGVRYEWWDWEQRSGLAQPTSIPATHSTTADQPPVNVSQLPATSFVERWNAEIEWGLALVLVAIGIALTTSRQSHFLAALLAIALAYFCIESGMVRIATFPDLLIDGKPATLPDNDISYVELWRWVAAGELILVAAVLLYRALGVGGLTLGFALTWMIAGILVYVFIGRIGMVRSFSAEIGSNAEFGTSPSQRPPTAPGLESLPRTPPALLLSVEARQRLDRQMAIREIAPHVWIALTSILAGIIAVCGLQLLIRAPADRMWVAYLLWLGIGVATTSLWLSHPPQWDHPWIFWLEWWTQSRYRFHLCWTLFGIAITLLWSGSIRSPHRPAYWMMTASVTILIGTFLTLAAVAVAIFSGAFPPLPTWVYILVAAGQSSLMWILLFAVSREELPPPAPIPAEHVSC